MTFKSVNEFHEFQMNGFAELMRKSVRVDEVCSRCNGRGEYPVQNGPDDFDIISCDCRN